MADVKFLTPEGIALINEAVLYPGELRGIRDQNLLASAANSAAAQAHYKPESTIFDLAFAYGLSIILNHAFLDGNKRTGAYAILVFLQANGYVASDEIEPRLEELVVRLATRLQPVGHIPKALSGYFTRGPMEM